MSAETLGVDTMVPYSSMMMNPLAMKCAWSPGSYSKFNGGFSQPLEMPNNGLPNTLGGDFDQRMYVDPAAARRRPINPDAETFSFADAMSSFTQMQQPMQHQYPLATTVDPTNMWQPQPGAPSRADSKVSSHSSTSSPTVDSTNVWQSQPSSSSRVDSKNSSRSSRSSPMVKIEGDDMSKRTPEMSHSPAESDSSLRARHAANQRHSKVEKARRDSHQNNASSTATERKKERLREKNKVAAAKCRQRQRRQAQSIREKGARLSEANARLKGSVQELRGELNSLRAIALYHQECNCEVAQYNCHQAERVAAEYISTYSGHSPTEYQGQTGVSPL